MGFLGTGIQRHIGWDEQSLNVWIHNHFPEEMQWLLIRVYICPGVLVISYIFFFWFFRWAAIAAQLPGRTDNEIKNLWNTCLKKRLLSMGIDPSTHKALFFQGPNVRAPACVATSHVAQWENARLEAEARLSQPKDSSLVFSAGTPQPTESDYFLLMWNSEVGESFRKLPRGSVNQTATGCSISRGSSCVRMEFNSPRTEAETLAWTPGPGSSIGPELGPNSSSSTEFESSSDTALQMLLEFPINYDMSFLDGAIISKPPLLPPSWEHKIVCFTWRLNFELVRWQIRVQREHTS